MKKRYRNLKGIKTKNAFQFFIRWIQKRIMRPIRIDEKDRIEKTKNVEIKKIKQNKTNLSITWIGHSSFLIQLNGLNILTDPVLSSWMGLRKRLVEPGIEIDNLPNIDVILISHAHFDHLDFRTLKKIKGEPDIFVPIGVKKYFDDKKYRKVKEAEWWKSFTYRNVKFEFVPAQHWSKRRLNDTNKAHWGGWVIESLKESIYFVGDTGYFEGFKLIGERHDIDTVLMPIGAYSPEWFMGSSHINPEDAVKAFLDLKAKKFIPMHYGTFRLSDDTAKEALKRLNEEWVNKKLQLEDLLILKIGESFWEK